MAVVIIVILENCNNTNIVLLLEIMDHYIIKTDRKFKLNVFTKGKRKTTGTFFSLLYAQTGDIVLQKSSVFRIVHTCMQAKSGRNNYF